ncbi:hypothetical protein PUNSTDRAFT_52569 [Punctularia strigosozonata HHB-11173 SS5]|uniref:uncharacterized protein n=1 Tax=Punctularia strigosozonata (strain HHB-11173) TaxID=741275 RepID=UPI0004417856|nr:uncharacterized protein PUNSTDRAFT_52569 [Punctularia strigosozonata HHB-11173 SS5]EIN09292.1 hypothetical protein PUNSTDRAFT_52569 [Punctularia strigosozonata HHB-11173 SS5]
MRDEAEDIDRAMGETEAMAARVLMRVQSILLDVFEDIEHLNAKRATALLKMDDQDVDVSQPHSTNDDDETAPAPEDAPPETTKPPTPADYEAAIAMLSDLRSRISNDVVPNEHLQALCAEIDVFRAQKHIPHVCPRTAEQQEATQWFPFSQPRPRIGVDPQGFPYEDWGHSPPSNSRFIRRLEKENLLLTPLSARRPRVFKKQCMVQFQHIPLSILTQMEIWHYEQGRCSDCIVRALKTFPPWVIDLVTNEALEDGNPVFRNGLKDELIEWDDATRRCRHLVFDHYRWIAIEELEERAYDSAADPLIVNGTRATPVPAYNRYHWIDGLRRP